MNPSTTPTNAPDVTPAATMQQQYDIVRPKPAARLSPPAIGGSRFQERFSMAISEYPNFSPEAQRKPHAIPRKAEAPRVPEVNVPQKRSCVGQIVSYFENIMTKKITAPAPPPQTDIDPKAHPPLPPKSDCQLKRNQWGIPRRPQAARTRERKMTSSLYPQHQDHFLDIAQRAKRIDLGHVPGGSADDYFGPQKAPQAFKIKRKPVVPRTEPSRTRIDESSCPRGVSKLPVSNDYKDSVAKLRLSLGVPFSQSMVFSQYQAFWSALQQETVENPVAEGAQKEADVDCPVLEDTVQQPQPRSALGQSKDWSEQHYRVVPTGVSNVYEWEKEDANQISRMLRWESFEEPVLEDD